MESTRTKVDGLDLVVGEQYFTGGDIEVAIFEGLIDSGTRCLFSPVGQTFYSMYEEREDVDPSWIGKYSIHVNGFFYK